MRVWTRFYRKTSRERLTALLAAFVVMTLFTVMLTLGLVASPASAHTDGDGNFELPNAFQGEATEEADDDDDDDDNDDGDDDDDAGPGEIRPFLDGRIDGRQGDRIAIYCNATGVEVYGITPGGSGIKLGAWPYAELLAVGLGGRNYPSESPEGGSVTVGADPTGLVRASWIGGIYDASGSPPFAKLVTCGFAVDPIILEAFQERDSQPEGAPPPQDFSSETDTPFFSSSLPRPTNPPGLAESQPGYAIVDVDNLFMRSGPGTQYTPVAILDGGTRLVVVGRNLLGADDAAGLWWYVQVGALAGWVKGDEDFLILRGDLSGVTVVPVPTGQVIQPTLVVGFSGNLIYPAPEAVNPICPMPSGEFRVIARNEDGSWFQIMTRCGNTDVIGWLQAERGLLRNPGDVVIPVAEGPMR